jgi:hypothetical protein
MSGDKKDPEYFMVITLMGYYPEIDRFNRMVLLGKTIKSFKTLDEACDFRDKMGLVLH